MSRKFYILILAAVSFLMITSCRKDGHGRGENRSETLNVSIDAGQMYQLNLRQYGDAGASATILKQALSYSTSAIVKNAAGDNIYNYLKAGSPKTGGNGTDQVLLKVATSGERCNNKETSITINFTIR